MAERECARPGVSRRQKIKAWTLIDPRGRRQGAGFHEQVLLTMAGM